MINFHKIRCNKIQFELDYLTAKDKLHLLIEIVESREEKAAKHPTHDPILLTYDVYSPQSVSVFLFSSVYGKS